MAAKSHVLVIYLSMVLAGVKSQDVESPMPPPTPPIPCTRRCYNDYEKCLEQCVKKEPDIARCYKDCDPKLESCYAECPDEEKNTQCYLEGEKKFLKQEEFFKKDDCTRCYCLDKKVYCETKTCKVNCTLNKSRGHWEPPICEYEARIECPRCEKWPQDLKCLNSIIKLGECCWTCPDKAKCLWKQSDRMYEEGEKFKKDDCTECTCVNEKIECQTETCKEPAQLNCLNPITKAGECCPVCEDEEKSKVSCQKDQCKEPNCLNPITQAGQCCPTCPDKDANPTEKPLEIKDTNANNNTQLASTATKGHGVASSFLLMTWAHLLVRLLSWLH